jgi:hypothetical protein
MPLVIRSTCSMVTFWDPFFFSSGMKSVIGCSTSRIRPSWMAVPMSMLTTDFAMENKGCTCAAS